MTLLQADNGPSIGQLVVIMLGTIPVLGILSWSAVKILGPIGQAVARRLTGEPGGDQLARRVELLADELEQVKAQLAETHERLDFTERLLAQSPQPEQLPKG